MATETWAEAAGWAEDPQPRSNPEKGLASRRRNKNTASGNCPKAHRAGPIPQPLNGTGVGAVSSRVRRLAAYHDWQRPNRRLGPVAA
jgi:hypothetical protein